MVIAEFFKIDSLAVPQQAPYGYFLLLVLYIIKKESNRWLDIKWKKRKGEYYLVLWFVQLLLMLMVQFLSHDRYTIPFRLFETIIGIVAAYSGAVLSIILHHLVNSDTVLTVVKLYLNQLRREAVNKTANNHIKKVRT